jgi:hypothetical protein
MSYVRGLVPDHPSLERLTFKRPESADSFYSFSSDFEKIAAKQKPRTLPTTARFGPTGYEKVPSAAPQKLLFKTFFVLFLFTRFCRGLGRLALGSTLLLLPTNRLFALN